MLKKILLIVAAVLVLLTGIIAMQPDTYQVTRSTEIAAPPAKVFSLVNDFHNWESWSPWAKRDPNMKATYSGAPSGAGAGYSWVGNDDVGEGNMTILDSRPNEKVQIKLEFLKPFASSAINEFTITPAGAGSRVEWAMTGESNFMSKGFGLAMGGMDKAIGPDFEKGLAQMKALAEN